MLLRHVNFDGADGNVDNRGGIVVFRWGIPSAPGLRDVQANRRSLGIKFRGWIEDALQSEPLCIEDRPIVLTRCI